MEPDNGRNGMTEPVYVPLADQGPGFYVYRAWRASNCIYVGLVGNLGPRDPHLRMAEHKSTDRWWADVARIDIAEFAGRQDIYPEELRQIRALRPPRNHDPDWRRIYPQPVWRPQLAPSLAAVQPMRCGCSTGTEDSR